jgi:hypothetical protein
MWLGNEDESTKVSWGGRSLGVQCTYAELYPSDFREIAAVLRHGSEVQRLALAEWIDTSVLTRFAPGVE